MDLATAIDKVTDKLRSDLIEQYILQGRAAVEKYNEVRKLKPSAGDDYTYTRITVIEDIATNWEEILKRDAEHYADASLAGFKAKMRSKLEALGQVVEVAFGGDLFYNSLKLNYANAEMVIANKVVLKVSKNGVFFNQYPTTFHNVTVNGEKVKTPSEAKVKKLLAAK